MSAADVLGATVTFMDPEVRALLQAAHTAYLKAGEFYADARRLDTDAREIVHSNGGSGNSRAWGIPAAERLKRSVLYPNVRWGTPAREADVDATVPG